MKIKKCLYCGGSGWLRLWCSKRRSYSRFVKCFYCDSDNATPSDGRPNDRSERRVVGAKAAQ
jgi:hypothetical protein